MTYNPFKSFSLAASRDWRGAAFRLETDVLLASLTQERVVEVPLGTISEMKDCFAFVAIIRYVGVYKICTLAYNRRLCRAAFRRVTKGTPRDKGKGREATCLALAVSTVCNTFVTQCSWHRR